MPLTTLHWVAGKWTLEEYEKLHMLVHTSLHVNAQLKKDPSDSRVDHRHVSLEFCLWVFSVLGFIHDSPVEWLGYDSFESVSCCLYLMAIDAVS
jgi:hypothetical protein